MRKIILLIALVFITHPALAQLSTNPWLTANDSKDVQKVYQKRQRRGKTGGEQHYQAEGNTVIDRTYAYIQDDALPAEEQDASLLDKVKNLVSSSPQKETPLIANTADNRRKLAQQKQQKANAEAKKADSPLLPSLGISSLTNSFKLPNVNATGMIKKFEKASGINLKAIGNSLK
ncbi:MAG: hypothetical protein NC218_12180 [Acetobacter sp.]|nr:hypothetical protein [Acetobacter sp.]